jgi:8-oxo-dGTP pyrophosphatase MutT (NUDIX family)
LKETPDFHRAESESTLDQGVYVGVSLIVESSDEHILMTQRSDHMRSFPRAWVPPGGHVEWDETLIEGGLRELEEETGLKLTLENSATRLLCLWESVYPVFLGMGNPKSHHIVVYLHVKAKKSWKELQEKIKVLTKNFTF